MENNNGKVLKNGKWVVITGKFNCQSYPLNDKAIFVSFEDLKQIDPTNGTKCFDVINNCIVNYDNTNDKLLENKNKEISLLKNLLSQSDYLCLKWCEGQISDIEYEYTKNKRKEYRLKINQLEQEIEQIKRTS